MTFSVVSAIWVLTEASSSRRRLRWRRINARNRVGHHPQPSCRNCPCRNREPCLGWGANLTARACDDTTQGRLPLAAGAGFALHVRRARRGHDDGRKGDPQRRAHKGEHRQETGGQGDHIARIRGSRGSVRPLATTTALPTLTGRLTPGLVSTERMSPASVAIAIICLRCRPASLRGSNRRLCLPGSAGRGRSRRSKIRNSRRALA